MGLIGMLFMIVWFPFAWLRSKLTGANTEHLRVGCGYDCHKIFLQVVTIHIS